MEKEELLKEIKEFLEENGYTGLRLADEDEKEEYGDLVFFTSEDVDED